MISFSGLQMKILSESKIMNHMIRKALSATLVDSAFVFTSRFLITDEKLQSATSVTDYFYPFD